MTFKECLYRELKYGTALASFFPTAGDRARIKMDLRLQADEPLSEENYPWLVFRRIGMQVDDRTGVVKETVEMDLIGKMSSATKNDDLLEQMKEALISHFGGKRMTFGKFTEDGTADPSGGMKMNSSHLESQDAFDDVFDEKVITLTFAFAYVRT